MAYSEYFVQQNWVSYWLGSSTTMLSNDLSQLETLTDQAVNVNSGTSADCFHLTSQGTSVEFGITFDTIIRVIGVVYVTMIPQDNPILNGIKYSENIVISTDTANCGTLTDATSNPEVTCTSSGALSK